MLLPNLEKATIDLNKLAGYVLNAHHPEGRHKARVFLAALGVAATEAEWLAGMILSGLRHADAVWQSDTDWGPIYRVDIDIVRGKRCALVRTAWLCAVDEVRLVTCFVIGECDETA